MGDRLIHDSLAEGRLFRVLSVVDVFSVVGHARYLSPGLASPASRSRRCWRGRLGAGCQRSSRPITGRNSPPMRSTRGPSREASSSTSPPEANRRKITSSSPSRARRLVSTEAKGDGEERRACAACLSPHRAAGLEPAACGPCSDAAAAPRPHGPTPAATLRRSHNTVALARGETQQGRRVTLCEQDVMPGHA